MRLVLAALARHLPAFSITDAVVNRHHNYVDRQNHYGANLWGTRKGAIRRTWSMWCIPSSRWCAWKGERGA